jgi:hypothetical protein
MTSRQALAFIRKHGVVLEAAQGPAPSLAEAIAGEPVRGNWWSHPKSHAIFAVTRAIRDSDDVLVCRLIKGKVIGPSMYPHVPKAALEGHSDPDKIWKPFDEAEASRRTVYAFIKRSIDDLALRTVMRGRPESPPRQHPSAESCGRCGNR